VQDLRMPRLRELLVPARDLAASVAPFALLALALLWGAYWILDPAPPARVVLATGPDTSAYAEFGRRYAQELARHGIEVELRATEGAADNLALLRDPASGVDLAFMQGGAGAAIHRIDEVGVGAPLVSLGNLFYEPVWIFYREQAAARVRAQSDGDAGRQTRAGSMPPRPARPRRTESPKRGSPRPSGARECHAGAPPAPPREWTRPCRSR